MESQDANRGGGPADPVGRDILGNAAPLTSNHMPYDNNTQQNREQPQFQHLISNDHTQLPSNPQFGMGHHFVTPFPGYMHAMPSGLYSLNMIDDTEHHPKRRRRTNYRDPENAAKLTTALGILIKQKEENKPQDLKSIALHFGLPYNTLRDNYLKVTTGKLVKEKGDKKDENNERPRQKRSANTSGHSSRTTSCATTPRDPATGASTPSASSSAMSHHPMGSVSYGSMTMPGAQNGSTAFGAYPMYHPQMGLHYMPQMAMPGSMQHMQNMQQQMQQQMQSGSMNAPGSMHSMLNGAPPMMHIFTAAPMGYQVNPATGRPYPVFAQPGGDLQQMQHQMQQQMQGSHSMQGQHQLHQPQAQGQQQQSHQPAPGAGTNGEAPSVPTTPHTAPHMLMPPMYVGAMPGTAPSMPGAGPQQGIPMPLPLAMPLPMFNPAAYAPHLGENATSAPAAASTGFSLLLPGPTYGSTAGTATTPSNVTFLAAAMTAAYGETPSNGNSASGTGPAQDGSQQQGMGSSGSSSSGASDHAGAGGSQSASTIAASHMSGAHAERSGDDALPERSNTERPGGSDSGNTSGSEDGGEDKASQAGAGSKRERR